jgi:dolichyl-phosphate beta-glucosyltransferase
MLPQPQPIAPADDPVFLSIVIPAYNEEARLPGTLETLVGYCRRYSFPWEIVAVVEKSTDNTAEAASVVAALHPEISVIVNQVRRGKGYALRTGFGLSRGEIVFSMDADLSVPPEYIGRFLDEFSDDPKVDVLVGNRHHEQSTLEIRQSRTREFLGRRFNGLVRALAATRLADTQCGFKAMRREAAVQTFLRQTLDGFACDVEILMLADRMGFKVRDLPVRWINSPESKVRIVRDSLAMLRDVLLVRRRVARTLSERPYAKNSLGMVTGAR